MINIAATIYLEEITSAKNLRSLYPDWQALFLRSGTTFFQSPDWLLAWWNHFGSGRLRSFALFYENRLVGVVPLYQANYESLEQIFFIGTGITDSQDILTDPRFAIPAVEILAEYLLRRHDNWDRCVFKELAGSSPLLNTVLPFGLTAEITQTCVSPAFNLPGSNDKFHASLDSVHRRKVFKARRTLESRLGPLKFTKAAPSDYARYLDELFRLHSAVWRTRGSKGVLDDPRVRDFHRDLASRLHKSDRLCLFCLSAGDNTVAIVYGFEYNGCYYSYLGGFDPAFASCSPGQVILLYLIEHCISTGVKRFDFLRGSERYKYLWTAADQPNFQLTIS